MLLLVRDDREYLREPGDTLETDLGVLDIPPDITPGQVLETHLGTEFRVRELRGPDFARHFERTGAPMLPRDVGLVIGHTGVGTDDRVLDAGTGTGVLAAYLGRLGADVLTYERDPEFAAVARENMAMAGVADRVDVRTGDVTDHLDALAHKGAGETGGISGGESEGRSGSATGAEADRSGDGEGFDLLTLDTADAPQVLRRAPDLLVPGGFACVYSPFVEHAREAIEAARGAILSATAHETIGRELDVDERGTRPTTAGVGHTGFLTVVRRD